MNGKLQQLDMIDGEMSVAGWANQLESIDTDHDWSGMSDSVKQYTESDFPLNRK